MIFWPFFLTAYFWLANGQVPIGTVMVAQQQQSPPTTSPIIPLIGSGNGAINELVDQIESIDVTATQMVITTTRQGPPDMARVSIQVVDIVSGEQLPAQNLTGILLVLTRGRYTVNWLRPDRWYGVHFRAEQHYAGGSAVYANEEAHLVKTHKADGSNEEHKQVLSVRAQRYGEGGKSLENLVLTLRWEQHPDERPNLEAQANITLFCNDQIKYRQLRLGGNEIDKSVEIRLDNHFEVLEQRNGSARQMVASIRPRNCGRICWNAELVAESRGWTFRRAATHNCEEISPISATANLRDFVGYELAPNNDLIIFTNYSEPDNSSSGEQTAPNDERDAFVQLTAIVVPEPKKADNLTIRYKTFNTHKHGDEFILDRLENGQIYAVQYTYGKQSPFAYEESRRFLVDTGSPVEPIHIEFNMTGEQSVQPGMVAIARLDSAFKNYELGIDVEPLCEANEPTIHFWLDKDRRRRELRELRLLDALCTASPGHNLCRLPAIAPTIKGCQMREGRLCWTANIVVHDKLFSAERKCQQLAKTVPQPAPSTPSPNTTMAQNGAQFAGPIGGPQNGQNAGIASNSTMEGKTNNGTARNQHILPVLFRCFCILTTLFSFIFL